MIFAVRCDAEAGTIDLWCSQADRPAPAGFEACNERTFLSVWRERDRVSYWQARLAIAQQKRTRNGTNEAGQ